MAQVTHANSLVESRKMKIIFIDPVQFMAFFREGLEIRESYKIIKGIPGDAQILGVSYDVRMNGIVMVVYSEYFEEVEKGAQLPVLPVEIQLGDPAS